MKDNYNYNPPLCQVVRNILECDITARIGDMLLYSLVLKYYGIDVDQITIGELARLNPYFKKRHGIPSYESVERVRRRLLKEFPHLNPPIEFDSRKSTIFRDTVMENVPQIFYYPSMPGYTISDLTVSEFYNFIKQYATSRYIIK